MGSRKILLHRKEIDRLFGRAQLKGLTLIPLRMYWVNGKAKVEIGICKGKKVYDKRKTMKEKQMKREAEAAISRQR